MGEKNLFLEPNGNKRQMKFQQYFRQAHSDRIDPCGSNLPQLDEDSYQSSRSKHLILYGHFSHILENYEYFLHQIPVVYILFDGEGNLLKLIGNQDLIRQLPESLFARGLIWTLDTVGPNAVTIGQTEHIPVYSLGKENYHTLLQPYALYYSPVLYNDIDPPFQDVFWGGVACLAPVERHHFSMLSELFLMTHDAINFQYLNSVFFELYDQDYRTIIACSKSVISGNASIFYHSKNLEDVLNTKLPEKWHARLHELIDPPPANLEFWELFDSKQPVHERAIQLSIRGVKGNYILTTRYFERPLQRLHSVHLYITTRARIAAYISDRSGNNARLTFNDVIGSSPALQATLHKAKLLAGSSSNIMLLGESGTGKDILSQAIHNSSPAKNGPFIAVNCGAIPRDLIASELFGYESGAFTGAKKGGNIGKFELANNGTIFLDEIGELPLELQAVLLRVVEGKKLTRVGGTASTNINVRIISATNVNIMSMIEKGQFRADLYYRLSVLKIDIPPLRDRSQDIILLAEHFIHTVARRLGIHPDITLSAEAKQLLLRLPWKGNVRELQNVIERIVQIYPDAIITPEHILANLDTVNFRATSSDALNPSAPPPKADFPLPSETSTFILPSLPDGKPDKPKRRRRHQLEREEIQAVLKQCNNNLSESARHLGISRTTLYRYMDRLDLW